MNRGRALRQITECLRGAAPKAADWAAILSLANETLLTPALIALVRDPNTPADVSGFLVEVDRRNAERNASLLSTLSDAATALNAVGIEPILLKGVATWFDDGALLEPVGAGRITSDIDTLTPGDDFRRAATALCKAGFSILEDNSAQAHHPVIVFGRSTDAGSIDLHARAPGPPGIVELDELAALSTVVMHKGFRALLPPSHLQILILALHDQLLDGHLWRGGFEPRHLLDIAALASRRASVDWPRLMAISSRHHIRALVEAQLHAAKAIAAADIPNACLSTFVGGLHYWRQRMQFVFPVVNAPFHVAGLNRDVWRHLSSRALPNELRSNRER